MPSAERPGGPRVLEERPPGLLAAELAGPVRTCPAALGGGRLVCLDGPAGSGKTTLAGAVAEELHAQAPATSVAVLHMDDLYAGWTGLVEVEPQLARLLSPLAQGRSGRYRRWDWQAGSWAGTVPVPPVDVLVLEGVGSGCRAVAPYLGLLVWCDGPDAVRRERALARDGATFAPHWEAWAAQEREHFARHQTASRADVVIRSTPGGTSG